MTVVPTSYPGWNNHPAFHVNTFEDWQEICMWMYRNKVEHFLLSSGSHGYTFQVRDGVEWFLLKWS